MCIRDRFRVKHDGVTVAEIPALPLTDSCPTYEREGVESPEIAALRSATLPTFAAPDSEPGSENGWQALVDRMMTSPNLCSRRWIYEQYDTTVRTSTVRRPGGDAGAVAIRGTQRAVAATTDCNGRYVYLDPRSGAHAAVAEAARNLVCVGALPTAITNNLNFGNPLKAPIYYQLREAVRGIGEACQLFETPVTGGNVSLFNETDGRAIHPTPVIGMVGVVDNVEHLTSHAFQQAGDAIVLLGANTDEMGGSEYLYRMHDGLIAGRPPAVDLMGERALQQATLAMIGRGLVHSAHDCAEGGLLVALLESAIGNGRDLLGFDVELDDALEAIPLFFSEGQGRIVISCAPDTVADVLALARQHEVPAKQIGTVTQPGSDGSAEPVRVRGGGADFTLDLAAIAQRWFGALSALMDSTPSSDKADA